MHENPARLLHGSPPILHVVTPSFRAKRLLLSSPRKRGGGFTFEVQHFGEGLCRGPEVKAFSRGVVVSADECIEAAVWECGEIGLARNEAAHATDGVLDATLLPGRIGVAEEGPNGEPMELLMTGELGAVVEGDGLAQRWRHAGEEPDEMACNALGSFVGRSGGEQKSGLALVNSQHGLAVFGEQHEVGFPVSGALAVGGSRGPFGHRNTAFDEACGTAPAPAAAATLALAAGQIATPVVVLGAGNLGVDEAVDTLVADHRAARFAGQPTGHLFGGPAASEPLEHGAAQGGVAFQARPRPAPRPRLLLSVTWFVTNIAATVAPYLARNGRWRAIQSCSDLPDRLSIGLKLGNLASVVQ